MTFTEVLSFIELTLFIFYLFRGNLAKKFSTRMESLIWANIFATQLLLIEALK